MHCLTPSVHCLTPAAPGVDFVMGMASQPMVLVVIIKMTIFFSGISSFYDHFGKVKLTQPEENSNLGSCPILVGLNSTGNGLDLAQVRCSCTDIMEIRCDGLSAVPVFAPDPRTFRAIHLSRQSIHELPRGCLAGLRVRKLVLNLNPIGDRVSGDALAGSDRDLEELELGGCMIETLPLGLLAGMRELHRLHLWRNRIDRIPSGFFHDATNLRELILWGNRIRELDDDVFAGLHQLRRLDLDRNRITEINRNAFRHLEHSLEALHFGENGISTLHESAFPPLRRLRALNLDHNRLRYVYHHAFQGLDGLVSLSLNGNQISLLPDDVFSNLHNLTVLHLQDNELIHVWTKTFNGLWSLQTLNLSRNRLSNLPEGVFHQSTGLIRLSLDGNKLRTLRRCAFARTARLRSLSLLDNPVVCECRLAWMAQPQDEQEASALGDAAYYQYRSLGVWGSCRLQEINPSVDSRSYRAISDPLHYRATACLTTARFECQED